MKDDSNIHLDSSIVTNIFEHAKITIFPMAIFPNLVAFENAEIASPPLVGTRFSNFDVTTRWISILIENAKIALPPLVGAIFPSSKQAPFADTKEAEWIATMVQPGRRRTLYFRKKLLPALEITTFSNHREKHIHDCSDIHFDSSLVTNIRGK